MVYSTTIFYFLDHIYKEVPIFNEKALFTRLLKVKQPWYIDRVEFDEERERVDVYLSHTNDLLFPCPDCATYCSVYDHQAESVWQHLNTFQYKTFIHCRLPRVKCKTHGVKQILPVHAEPGSRKTVLFESFVIDLQKECSLSAVARITGLTWDETSGIMDRAVKRGLDRKEKKIPEFLGVDEKSFSKGQKYETIVCDQKTGYVEAVLDNREQKSLEAYYKQFSKEQLAQVESVSMDMWDPFIAATKAYIPGAEKKIVFDKYHIVQYIQKAVDTVRKEEHKILQASGNDILKGTKYLFLWNEENIPEWRKEEFASIKKLDLKVSRAWAIKENFRHFWEYSQAGWAKKYFDKWYFWATHSRLPSIIKAAKTIKNHLDNVLTYFKHRVSNGLSEAINSNIEKVKRMAYGFRSRDNYRMAILFHCGGLDLYPRT